MKKSTLLLILMQAIAVSMYGQTTNFGTGSGTFGYANSHFGYYAGGTGMNNSFFGHGSGTGATGNYNTAIGAESFTSSSGGSWNTALGSEALRYNTIGYQNTSVGGSSLYFNTTGYDNTAIGVFSLRSNTTGHRNTANGNNSLTSNTEGHDNIAIGYSALLRNTTGSYNMASGVRALQTNTTGNFNVANGISALANNRSGNFNSAYGTSALTGNYTGSVNSAFGYLAGPSIVTTDLNNTTALGQGATPTGSNQVRIGNSSVVSIRGQVNWSALSDGRFKRDLKEDVAGLEFINRLRPVSYSLDKGAIDKFLGVPDSVRQLFPKSEKNVRESGFIAQEVEEVVKKGGYVFHGVEAPQNENDYYGIRYAEFVVPLVKAVQELTAKVEMQEKFAQEQKKEMDVLKQQLKMSGTSTVDEYNSKTEVALYQNNPNPFTVATEIGMSLPENIRQATLIIYNMEGTQLKVIPVNDRGKTVVKIESNELKAGMYFYSLLVDGKVLDTKRMILTSY